MKLDDIIGEVEVLELEGDPGTEITGIAVDSRNVGEGFLFVAVPGTRMDGHAFIGDALKAGAGALVCEHPPEQKKGSVPWVKVPDARKALALMASAFYGHPSRELKLVGVTGTNGKTTVATLLHRLHTVMGFHSGLLSTIQVEVGKTVRPATHTTPDSLKVNMYLREMADAGCDYCFMEVSSHAIHQDRIKGLAFRGGIFTNLSREHLDYHKDFRSYLEAKKQFFDRLPESAFALVNADDRNGKVMLQNCGAGKYTFSLRSMADFRGKINEMHLEGSSLSINDLEVWIRLPGKFNAANILAVYGTAVLLGQKPAEVSMALSEMDPVPGRFETIRKGTGTTGIVDYAHTPDALQKVLDTIREVNVSGGKIITVVGAGGNRDRGKRPAMARIAAETSHRVILTSDNPRDEDPEKILDEMMKGIEPAMKDRTLRIVNREEGIRAACMMAGEKDIVLVAGKGHEKTQEIGGRKIPFDDVEVLKKNLKG